MANMPVRAARLPIISGVQLCEAGTKLLASRQLSDERNGEKQKQEEKEERIYACPELFGQPKK
jgi:hypothetical protein